MWSSRDLQTTAVCYRARRKRPILGCAAESIRLRNHPLILLSGADLGWTKSPEECFFGAIEGTRTPTPLPVHGPEPCASANSATMAIWTCNAAAAPRPPCQEDQHF